VNEFQEPKPRDRKMTQEAFAPTSSGKKVKFMDSIDASPFDQVGSSLMDSIDAEVSPFKPDHPSLPFKELAADEN